MRVELKEMELMNVTGGQANNTVYRKDMNVSVEHALLDASMKSNIVPLGRKTKQVKSTIVSYC